MWQTKPYRDAIDLQKLITTAAPASEPKDLASLAKSFVALEQLKLRLRMKGPPKAVDGEKLAKSKRKSDEPNFIE